MSLINDALKRAKTAQQQAEAPAPGGPQLRPVEPTQPVRHGLGLALPVGCVVVALLGAFLLWRVASHRGTESQASNSTDQGTTVAARTAAPMPVAETTKPVLAPVPSASALVPQTVSNAVTTVSTTANSSSNATSGAEAPPKPALLKLQGIVYNPTRPSATISGRTVFVGDRVGEFRVIAIGKDSATLVGGGKTNQLDLLE